jgi:hypothetical protein
VGPLRLTMMSDFILAMLRIRGMLPPGPSQAPPEQSMRARLASW